MEIKAEFLLPTKELRKDISFFINIWSYFDIFAQISSNTFKPHSHTIIFYGLFFFNKE